MKTKELKLIAERFSLAEIEQCINDQIAEGSNACVIQNGQDEVFAVLSKATVLRELMDEGMSYPEALRELGRRIRAVYTSDDSGGS